MTLEQLKYLQAIVEHGSFRAAAESVHRSQSSLSIGIQKLERDLGLTLFARDMYRPQLTKQGQAIYHKAQKILQKSDELHSLASHLARGCETELRLAISGIIPIEPIIKVFNDIAKIYPETRIIILIENLSGTMERIHDDDADIAITDLADSDGVFETTPLTTVKFVSVVPSRSPWAANAQSITEQDLEQETQIIVRDTSHHSPRISKGIVTGSPQWVVNDFPTKQQIIRSGKGWGRMPMHLVEEDIKLGVLTMLTGKDFPVFSAPLQMVRKKNKYPGPVEQALWSALQQFQWQTY